MVDLPESFIQFTRERHGELEANAWFERLPALLEKCAQRWQLNIFPPFENLSFHYVAPAECADGTPVIIKTCSLTDEFANAARALRLFDGSGMVRLLKVDEEEEVMLLERLSPGTLLSQLVPEHDEQATSILASVMRKIWRPAPVDHPFPTVERWGQGLARLRAHYAGGYGPFPPYLVDEATALFKDLCASAGEPMLLHGDLHHENILRTGDEWCAIDPKGVVGDPGYEVGTLFYNPMPQIFNQPDLQKIIVRRVDQLAEELSIERARIRGWGLAQCVLSAWWGVEDVPGSEPTRGVLACAEVLSNLRR